MRKDTVFEKNFSKVSSELEKFCNRFVIKGVPPEYKGIWVPKNEICAWAIPRQSGEVLRALALASRAKTFLELGTSFGYSTLWLAAAAKYNGGKVYTIEVAKPKIKVAKQNFTRARLHHFIKQIEGSIAEVLSGWRRKVDFVFMDADKMNYFKYIKLIEPHLRPGAIIVADNASDFGHLMKEYLRYISQNPAYHSYLLDIDHGLMISIKL